jgi:hypothetical protein
VRSWRALTWVGVSALETRSVIPINRESIGVFRYAFVGNLWVKASVECSPDAVLDAGAIAGFLDSVRPIR